MTSGFGAEFLEAMKPVAHARLRGGVLRRLFGFGGRPPVVEYTGGTIGDFNAHYGKYRATSYFTAIQEVGEAFTPRQRSEWLSDGTLPEGFWKEVERRAREWDSLH